VELRVELRVDLRRGSLRGGRSCQERIRIIGSVRNALGNRAR